MEIKPAALGSPVRMFIHDSDGNLSVRTLFAEAEDTFLFNTAAGTGGAGLLEFFRRQWPSLDLEEADIQKDGRDTHAADGIFDEEDDDEPTFYDDDEDEDEDLDDYDDELEDEDEEEDEDDEYEDDDEEEDDFEDYEEDDD